MSKAIVMIDIPTDYADEYKQWIIDGRLCYLEDGAWTFLKEVEYKVEPYREVIPIEWIKKWCLEHYPTYPRIITEQLLKKTETWQMIEDWEKENEQGFQSK